MRKRDIERRDKRRGEIRRIANALGLVFQSWESRLNSGVFYARAKSFGGARRIVIIEFARTKALAEAALLRRLRFVVNTCKKKL